MTDKPDQYDEKAAELLPCRPFACRSIQFTHENPAMPCTVEHLHSINCPASWRPAVAAALRETATQEYARGCAHEKQISSAITDYRNFNRTEALTQAEARGYTRAQADTVQVINNAREEGETDLRSIRARIAALQVKE